MGLLSQRRSPMPPAVDREPVAPMSEDEMREKMMDLIRRETRPDPYEDDDWTVTEPADHKILGYMRGLNGGERSVDEIARATGVDRDAVVSSCYKLGRRGQLASAEISRVRFYRIAGGGNGAS